jgi:hypothetical protein
MRRALRLTGWVGVGLLLAAFFFALWASLRVRQAVDEGALSKPVWSCLSRPDAKRLDRVSDRAFIRAVQAHIAGYPENVRFWQWNGLVATIGARISFSEAERVAAMRPMVATLPLCQRQEARARDTANAAPTSTIPAISSPDKTSPNASQP